MSKQEQAKANIARYVVENYVKDGMLLGLGSGSTADLMIDEIGRQAKAGLNIRAIASSEASAKRAQSWDLPLLELTATTTIDITLDGADEIDPKLNMIKGGGGCLLREKIIAQASQRFVAMIDESKLSPSLGSFPLPIEIVSYGWAKTATQVSQLLQQHASTVEISLRGGLEKPFITDNHNYIIDCKLEQLGDLSMLAPKLLTIAGVVETGLFMGIAKSAVVGYWDGRIEVL